MSDASDQILHNVEQRLSELEEELSRLQTARDVLTGQTTRQPASAGHRRSVSTRRRARRGSHVPRGQRPKQMLAALVEQPGADVPQLAEVIGVSRAQVYGIARALTQTGAVARAQDGGFYLTGDRPEAVSADPPQLRAIA